jgi:hypothetical protein
MKKSKGGAPKGNQNAKKLVTKKQSSFRLSKKVKTRGIN